MPQWNADWLYWNVWKLYSCFWKIYFFPTNVLCPTEHLHTFWIYLHLTNVCISTQYRFNYWIIFFLKQCSYLSLVWRIFCILDFRKHCDCHCAAVFKRWHQGIIDTSLHWFQHFLNRLAATQPICISHLRNFQLVSLFFDWFVQILLLQSFLPVSLENDWEAEYG